MLRPFLFFLANQILLILILSVNRLALLLRYAPSELWDLYRKDLWLAFARGFRFDLKVATFIWLPLLVIALLDAFLRRERTLEIMRKCALAMWLPLLALIMVDQQYYAFFQSHINVLAFGFAEDDTAAVLVSIWTDHPVIRWFLVVGLTYAAIVWLARRYPRWTARLPVLRPKKRILLYALYIPVHVMCMRGSFTIFPLQRDDAIISNHPFLNFLVVNPYFALKEAVQEKKNTSIFVSEATILQRQNQSSVESALAKLGKKSWEEIFATSPRSPRLLKKSPHVVYVMMESWSNFLFDYQSAENDLLSTFGPHAKEDYLYRNVLSSMNSTLPSMESMLLGKEIRDVFVWNSPFRFSSFPSALAKVYKDKGYRTVFITSGKLGWRNLNQWVPRQGFDEAFGQSEILKRYKDAQDCSWGVYDEYSFRLAGEYLKQSQPTFVFVMTTSNHTPYEVPTHFRPHPNKIPAELAPTLTTSLELAEKSLIGFQYANKALGDFLSGIKSDAQLSDRTVVLAVGDHNSWMLAPRNSQIVSFKKTLSVPLYIYVPPYLRDTVSYRPERAASHKDIISTLVPLTLSEARYLNFGANLLQKENQRNHFYALNSDSVPFKTILTPGDEEAVIEDKARAYLAINHIYFQREFCRIKPSWCEP